MIEGEREREDAADSGGAVLRRHVRGDASSSGSVAAPARGRSRPAPRSRPEDQSLNPFKGQSERRSSGSTVSVQGGPFRLSITHIFPRRIKVLLTSRKAVSLYAEQFVSP